ncbi:MAG: hypothetical protein KF830_06605 [Planctomycetes bacterium]|nr:hypothetical protein [Planctomycetota bacterium]
MRSPTLPFLFLLAACGAAGLLAPTRGAIGFDGPLDGWRQESTGGRGPHATWTQQADRAAISPPNVLALVSPNHDAEERFNLCWNPALAFRDGRIAVAVRADGGQVDQGGGPMWRVQDADNYYLCRYNPLEANYRVYVVHRGVRRQLATALVEADGAAWHRLEVEHAGNRIRCWFDGRELLSAEDGTIDAPGGVGLWTKADARTSFDDLSMLGRGR